MVQQACVDVKGLANDGTARVCDLLGVSMAVCVGGVVDEDGSMGALGNGGVMYVLDWSR